MPVRGTLAVGWSGVWVQQTGGVVGRGMRSERKFGSRGRSANREPGLNVYGGREGEDPTRSHETVIERESDCAA